MTSGTWCDLGALVNVCVWDGLFLASGVEWNDEG